MECPKLLIDYETIVGEDLVKVTILRNQLGTAVPSYKFVMGDPSDIRAPWSKSGRDSTGLSSFELYSRPVGVFRTGITFCSNVDPRGVERWSVSKRLCMPGWKLKFTLYGSSQRSKSSVLYFVGTRPSPFGNSAISKTFPGSEYRSGLFFFYGPQYEESVSRSTPPAYNTRRTTPQSPTIATTTQRTPTIVTTKPGIRKQSHRNPSSYSPEPDEFNKECLEAHNFFRAIHNVPPLRWSAKLSKSARKWAEQLKFIAPRRPSAIDKPHLKTYNWPHSVAGSEFRDRNYGENIAWDLSGDGSPARESVLRFYVELFYYNRKHPTYSPGPNKPVGHLTQLLWKDTTHIGCGTVKTRVGPFKSLSTWTVIHYSPGGNHRYRSSVKRTVELYDEQVPEMISGSCMTRFGSCNRGNQCMAFGPARGKCECTKGQPKCFSPKGCVAWCVNKRGLWPWKEECEGSQECKCSPRGAVCR